MRKRKTDSANIIDLSEAREKRRLKRAQELNKRKKGIQRPKRIKATRTKRQIIKSNRIRYTILVLSFFLLLFLGFSTFTIVTLKMQENQALALSEKLKNDKAKLQNELKLINTPEYLEQQARLQLKMIKPGELLYVFPTTSQSALEETID
jgi:cell division protein DivIC